MIDDSWETEWSEWADAQPEEEWPSEEESSEDDDIVRTHPKLEAVRQRWAVVEARPARGRRGRHGSY